MIEKQDVEYAQVAITLRDLAVRALQQRVASGEPVEKGTEDALRRVLEGESDDIA